MQRHCGRDCVLIPLPPPPIVSHFQTVAILQCIQSHWQVQVAQLRLNVPCATHLHPQKKGLFFPMRKANKLQTVDLMLMKKNLLLCKGLNPSQSTRADKAI